MKLRTPFRDKADAAMRALTPPLRKAAACKANARFERGMLVARHVFKKASSHSKDARTLLINEATENARRGERVCARPAQQLEKRIVP